MTLTKKLSFSFLAAIALASCSTEVALESEWKDIPVVYAFLSVQDTAHYVRVQKAFLEPGGDAVQIAQIADSIYYGPGDITVSLENSTTGDSYVLERVDGNQEGYPKQEGAFANDPNILYKLPAGQAVLSGGDEVALRIDRGDNLPPVTAQTIVLNEIDSVSSSPSNQISQWRYPQLRAVAWRPGLEAQIFDVRFVINYRESTPENPTQFTKKTLEWVVAKEVERTDADAERLKIDIQGQSFYAFLGGALPPSQGEIRIFDNMDLYITGSGQELLDFVRVAQANTGITSAQSIPTYTNLDGGLGVFTSRYQLKRTGFRITGEARDSLVNGIFTRSLNFR